MFVRIASIVRGDAVDAPPRRVDGVEGGVNDVTYYVQGGAVVAARGATAARRPLSRAEHGLAASGLI